MSALDRFWDSLQLAVDPGIDFPYLLYRLAVDGDIEPGFTYQVGVRLRWWLGEEKGRLARRLEAIPQFLGSAGRTATHEVYRRDEPAPAIAVFSQHLSAAVRGAIGRRGSRPGRYA